MTQTTRTYPVPSRVSLTTPVKITDDAVFDRACQYAAGGQVKGYQLPILASGSWVEGAAWAESILHREDRAAEVKTQALLASIGWTDASDHPYDYHGVLDSNIEDHEVIVGLIRSAQDQGRELEFWDGMDWGQIQFDDNEDVDFVLLDPDLLAAVVDSFKLGIGGVTLSPFRPKAWVPGESEAVEDFFSKLTPDSDSTPVVISVEGDDSSQLVASLGLPSEVDYESVQRATARWARRTDPMCAGGSLRTLRDLLVREGVRTPDFNLEGSPLPLETVAVTRGRDRQEYSIGQPVVASGGIGPDIIYAIVDEMDTSAVLDVIRVSPGPVAYKRSGGKWIKDQPTLIKLLGVNPPPVVELRPDQVDEVIGQVDAYDKTHPAKAKPSKDSVTAAGMWTEDLHPRQGGKFASKNGASKAVTPAEVRTTPTLQKAGNHVLNQGNYSTKIPSINTGFNPAAGQRTGESLAAIDDANRMLGHDHKFDVAFAQEGLGEARRREIFDRQLAGMRNRLARAGLNGRGLAVVVERKIASEKQRRDNFEKSRKTAAEQERIRRLKAKGPATITADASHMPRKLKDYWVAGKGAAKIRWGTSGDFKRCERALAKYLGPEQIAGACASLHHVATGQWPGKGRKH